MADSARVAYEKTLGQKLLQQRLDRAKENGFRSKEELRQERIAQQKENTNKLLTEGTTVKGLRGTNTAPFDAVSTTLNGLPALAAKGSFIKEGNQFDMEGYLPKDIQFAGTTLQGMQKGDTIFYVAQNKTPQMENINKSTTVKDPKNKFSDLRGSVTPGSSEAAASNLGEGASMDAAERSRKAGYPSGVVRPADYPIGIDLRTGGPRPSTDLGARLDPNATEQYAANFKAGQANMDQIQDMYEGEIKYKDTGKTALQLWAEANPALAQKEFAKAETKSLKPGGELYGYDTMDTFKPSDIAEADLQNPVDQAAALGGTLKYDAQTFADEKIKNVMAGLQNDDIPNMSLSDYEDMDIPDNLFLDKSDMKTFGTGFDLTSLPLTDVDPYSSDLLGSFPQPDVAPSLYGSFATVDRPYLMK